MENLMNPKIKHSRDRAFKRFVYIFFFLMCACFVLPLIVVISSVIHQRTGPDLRRLFPAAA